MARVALQLGRESISDSITAVLELVKNAYDAESEKVVIRFAGLTDREAKSKAVLVIEDDGYGMSEQQFRDQWMVIGTTSKVQAIVSPNKRRVLTGEKGLGRLGLDRLCEEAVVQTFAHGEDHGTELVIEWRKYEEPGQRLEDITHQLYKIPRVVDDPITGEPLDFKHGTRLILKRLKDTWTKESLNELRQELTLLVSPFAGINDFSVSIDSGMNCREIDGEVRSAEVLAGAEWKLFAEIRDDGTLRRLMTSSQHEVTFEDGPFSWQDMFHGADRPVPLCGPLEFEMYFFPRRRVELEDLNLSRKQVTDFLEKNQGIRIYRDEFRVKPYGDPNGQGDWLNLSYRRQRNPEGVRQGPLGRWKVGYNQVVGAVFIGRQRNENLIDQTNREGIVEGPAFDDLRAFATRAVEFFEFNRQKFELDRQEPSDYEMVRKAAEESTRASQEAVEGLKEASDRVRDMLAQAREVDSVPDWEAITSFFDDTVMGAYRAVATGQEMQKEFIKVAEDLQRELKQQKDTLGNLASLGILATSFGHETLASSNLVYKNAQQLTRSLPSALFMVQPEIRADIEDHLEILTHESEKIETFAEFTLRNVNRDKRNRKNVFLNRVVSEVFGYFEESLRERNISIDLSEVPKSLPPIRAFRIDWESIVVNLITNSVWGLQDTPKEKRQIRVSLKEVDGHIEMRFADSGFGLEPGTSDKIFLPTFSTKRNEKGQVIGTGMGLAIVKGFVESYSGGEISVESPCDLGGAEFLIRAQVSVQASDGDEEG
jgi:signal transduction histidine kinase